MWGTTVEAVGEAAEWQEGCAWGEESLNGLCEWLLGW